MRRREFIAGFGMVVGWSATAKAQQPAIPAVGFLQSRSASDAPHLADAFRAGLRESGFIDGHNVRIEYRWGDGDFARLPALAEQLIRVPVAVLAASGGEPAAMAAARAASATVPIVFAMSADPVKLGLAASFNRPGRNVTGVNIQNTVLEPKRLGLLHELVPQAKTIGVLLNPNFPQAESQLKDLQEAAPQVGLTLRVFRITADNDINAAFEAIPKEKIGALVVAGSPFFDTLRDKIAALAGHYRVPAVYNFREYAAAGGLMSYGIDIREALRQVGLYTGQILKGAKAGELPIVFPAKFELVINMKAANALSLTIPPTLLARADEVIE